MGRKNAKKRRKNEESSSSNDSSSTSDESSSSTSSGSTSSSSGSSSTSSASTSDSSMGDSCPRLTIDRTVSPGASTTAMHRKMERIPCMCNWCKGRRTQRRATTEVHIPKVRVISRQEGGYS